MLTLLAYLVLATLVSLAMAHLMRGLSRGERQVIAFAILAHLAAATAQVWVTRDLYGVGDMLSYWREGTQLAIYVEDGFTERLPALLALIGQSADVRIPVQIVGLGTSTGSMSGYAALLAIAVRGSLVAACMVVALASLMGKLLLYRAFSASVSDTSRKWLLVALVALPSSTFWSAGVLKESLAVLPLSVAVWGIWKLTQRAYFVGTLAILPSTLAVATLKAYLLLPLVIAAGAWFYAQRAIARRGQLTFRPLVLTGAILFVLVMVTSIGTLFPRYALENIEAEARRLQTVGVTVEGGSNFQLGGDDAGTPRSPLAQLVLIPLALVTALFRPFLFEVRTPLAALAAIETTLALALVWRAVGRRQWSRLRDRFLGSPPLLFTLVFTLVTAAAIGLSTTNFGSLSRYRAPMVPFFAIALLACQQAREPRRRPVGTPTMRAPTRRRGASRDAATTLSVPPRAH